MTKKKRVALLVHELDLLAAEFGLAMVTAHVPYIAGQGAFTPKMQDIWQRYVIWAMKAKKAGF